MCGICGFVTPSDLVTLPGRGVLERMTQTMIHRGPDDQGILLQDGVGLGVRRLSIVDISGGHQPFVSRDGTIRVVANGEIYNFRELRTNLEARGHHFKTENDCEVILHLYQEKGIEAIAELRGMFGFAVHDGRRRVLHLGRDFFGIKPLYYAMSQSGSLVFGSEIRALLASGEISPDVDPVSLWHYLTFQYVPGTRTLFKGVHRVAPGGFITYKDGQVSETIWGRPELDPSEDGSLEEVSVRIRESLEESVEAHTTGEAGIGAFLSSGVDSSLITALLRRRGPCATYSVGFEDSTAQRNELAAAAEVAAQLGTDHHEILVSADHYRETLPHIIWHQEDPVADPSAPGLYFVTEVARHDVKVLLSGEGADELFGGYPIYREPSSLALFDLLPPSVRRGLGHLASLLPEGVKGRSFFLRGSLPLEERFVGGAKMFSEDMKHALLPELKEMEPSTALTRPFYAGSENLDPATRMQQLDLAFWLPGDILAKADKMTMANSIEARVPFLDRKVFEVARHLAPRHKISGATTKRALRLAAAPFLPDGVADRPKLGFPVPLREWLRGPMRDFSRDLLGGTAELPMFSRKAVEGIVEDQERGLDRSRVIFTLMTFCLWHRMFIQDFDVGGRAVSGIQR